MEKWMSRLVQGLFGVNLLWIFWAVLGHSSWFRITEVPNWRLLPVGCALLAGVGWVYFRLALRGDQRPRRETELALAVCTLFLFAFQVTYCYCAWFPTGWDSNAVTHNAALMAQGKYDALSHGYFSRYPNNILLTWLYSLILRASGLVGVMSNFSIVLFQCVLSAATGLLVFRLGEELSGSTATAWWAWGIYAIFLGTSPWVMIPYSDATGLLFPLLILWLYHRRDGSRRDLLRWALMGLLTLVGYKLKPQLAIMAIALWIVEVGCVFRKGEWRARLTALGRRLAAFGLAFLLGLGGVNWLVIPAAHIQFDPEMTFSPAHFLMMGLRKESWGGYYDRDIQFSASFETARERREANLRRAEARLATYSPGEMVEHLLEKTAFTYADGTFFWGLEGGFIQKEPPDRSPLSPFFKSLFYPQGSRAGGYTLFRQIVWLGLLVGCLGLLVGRRPAGDLPRELQAAALAVMGLTLFEMLFEARSRYLYASSGVFVLLGALGWSRILTWRPGGRGPARKEGVGPAEGLH